MNELKTNALSEEQEKRSYALSVVLAEQGKIQDLLNFLIENDYTTLWLYKIKRKVISFDDTILIR